MRSTAPANPGLRPRRKNNRLNIAIIVILGVVVVIGVMIFLTTRAVTTSDGISYPPTYSGGRPLYLTNPLIGTQLYPWQNPATRNSYYFQDNVLLYQIKQEEGQKALDDFDMALKQRGWQGGDSQNFLTNLSGRQYTQGAKLYLVVVIPATQAQTLGLFPREVLTNLPPDEAILLTTTGDKKN